MTSYSEVHVCRICFS